jgi:multimeric flavodoxin WrbA/putative sterol carrier protein
MKRLLGYIPFTAVAVLMIVGRIADFDVGVVRMTSLVLACGCALVIYRLQAHKQASPIHKAMGGYLVLTVIGFWLWPSALGAALAAYPASILYTVLFTVAVGPLLFGREVFTTYFARKTTPQAVWNTKVFITINRHLTGIWAGLFLVGIVSSAIPGLFGLQGPLYSVFFEGLLPTVCMLAIGLPMNSRYPEYYQRKLGLTPVGPPNDAQSSAFVAQSSNPSLQEDRTMTNQPSIVAINGSPHAGIGNTSMMIEMLRPALTAEGFQLDVICLTDYEIDYCKGCGWCMEKGKCWIPDDHADIVKRLLAADGIILGSPVYFLHVTAQMKTFLDRSLAFGHKPRLDWKPGLAVSVSAGYGETHTAEYLAGLLRVYGAFSIGTLTAIGTGPGGFVGQDAVEARAQDLARDLARAVREKRRYPVTDMDLRYYQFMGDLVKRHKDTVMKHDYQHWQKLGLYESFEHYIQQSRTEVQFDDSLRQAWIEEMIAGYKAKKKSRTAAAAKASAAAGPQTATSCRELLQMMPLGFNAEAADGLQAVLQFEVDGDEEFTAHLKIADGHCTYYDGRAERPSAVIKTPAQVWLAIARKELDGQQAFMSGKYTAEGDLSLLIKLKSLFSR